MVMNLLTDRYFKNLTLDKQHAHKTWLEVGLTLLSIDIYFSCLEPIIHVW